MTASEQPSLKSLTAIPKWAVIAFTVFSLIGFLDATFLTIEHYRGVVPPCSVLKGCEQVTTSQYATVGPVPLALLGAIFYGVLFFLTIAYFDTKKEMILRLAAGLTAIGFLASLYFVYLQFFVIKAVCLYCMISAASSFLLFFVSIFILRKR